MRPLEHPKLSAILLTLVPLLMVGWCNGVAAKSVFRCRGDVLESYSGSAVSDNEREYKHKDSLAVVIDENRIRLVGPTVIPVAQDIDAKGNSILGYEFTICEQDVVHIMFNNYACKRLKNVYSGFTEYSGEFNKVTGRFQLLLRNTHRDPKIDAAWSANYICDAVK